MNTLVENKVKQIEELCIKYDVKSMYLFGSSSDGNFTDLSDIDILVEFKELAFDKYTDNYFDLHYDLQSLLEREIDLVTVNSLSNPYFIQSIEQTKQLLYAA